MTVHDSHPQTPVLLRASNVVKSFAEHTALAGVDLTVARSETIAIMGPSGSGKSTLLHCLAGIVRPDHGEVALHGERFDDWNDRRRSALRRNRFGFVFQSGHLLPELQVDENIALPLMLNGCPRRQALTAARRWLGPLGMDGLETRRPGQLSGGQSQRVALARALVSEPDIIFADEPTGALDRETGEAVMRLLLESVRRHGTSLVVVTHDTSVARHCTRTVDVRDGLLKEKPNSPSGPTLGSSS